MILGFNKTIAAGAAILSLGLSTVSLEAAAGERIRKAQVTEHHVERGEGRYERRTSVQTRRGQATKDVRRQFDRDAGTADATARVTGPDGSTASYNRRIRRTENGGSVNETYTDFQGRTATRDRSVETGDGTVSRNRSATYRNGGSATSSDVITRTDDGVSRDRSFATSRGGGGSLTADARRTEDGGTVSKVLKDKDGNVIGARDTAVEKTDTGAVSTTVFTNRDGETKTVTRSFEKDEND